MSSYEDTEDSGAAAVADVAMTEFAADEQVNGDAAAGDADAEGATAAGEEAGEAAAEEEREPTPVPTRASFATYLSSPVVTLVVGGGDSEETKEQLQLTAHQGLLTQSPYFATLCADLGDVSFSEAERATGLRG